LSQPNPNSANVPPAGPVLLPVIARIAKIALSDYRGFPSGQDYEFDLGSEGKNLLLFGENGSGKTSLFRALRDLSALRPGPTNYSELRNIFVPGDEGFISIQLTAGAVNEFRWDYGNDHPRLTAGQPYALLTERCRFLDYRALLETNFVHRLKAPNLFDLLVKEILSDLPVLVDGIQKPLGVVYKNMLTAKPHDHRFRRRLEAVDKVCADITQALVNHLPEVVTEGNRLISKMGYNGLSFDLKPETIHYNRRKRDFTGCDIKLLVTLFGKEITNPQQFLNEARLTALALAIYLGAARLVLQSPRPGADGTIMVRLLVLDDVLIGLDLANRLPVLQVLNDEFADWQIIILTYDRVWFDLAQIVIGNDNKWIISELYPKPQQNGTQVFEAPVIRKMGGGDAAGHFLDLARNRLAARDDRTAAFYARTAFEIKLKSYCQAKKVQVAYDMDGRNLTSDHLLDAIERRLTWSGKLPKALFALQRVKMFRYSVLNPLAHFHPVTLAANEVSLAVAAVAALQFPTDEIDLAKETGQILNRPALSSDELVDAANWLRTAFEVDMREFLVTHQGRVFFRHNWTELSLAELWEAAKEKMNAVNAAASIVLIADIELHRRVFLDEWRFTVVSTLTKADLDAAWAALRDPGSLPNSPRTKLATFHA